MSVVTLKRVEPEPQADTDAPGTAAVVARRILNTRSIRGRGLAASAGAAAAATTVGTAHARLLATRRREGTDWDGWGAADVDSDMDAPKRERGLTQDVCPPSKVRRRRPRASPGHPTAP